MNHFELSTNIEFISNGVLVKAKKNFKLETTYYPTFEDYLCQVVKEIMYTGKPMDMAGVNLSIIIGPICKSRNDEG